MAVYDIIPNVVELTDVRDTLNFAGGVAGNTLDSLITEEAKINWASKRKPVISEDISCQDFDEAKPGYKARWWIGKNMNCGLIPKVLVNYKDIVDVYDSFNTDMNGWIYEIPRGGSSQPFRLSDFAGYAKDALPFLFNFFTPQEVSSFQDSFICQCMVPVDTGSNLTLNDFPNLRNCYFGVYIVNDNNTYDTRATSVDVRGSNVEFSPKNMPSGNYTAYPFLSTVKMIEGGLDIAGSYYTIPYLKPSKFVVGTKNLTIIIRAEKLTMERTITYEIRVNNPYSTTVLKNNVLVLRNASQEFDDPWLVGEQQKTIETITAPNGITTVATGQFTNVDITVYTNPKIWVSLGEGRYLGSAIPMSQVPQF